MPNTRECSVLETALGIFFIEVEDEMLKTIQLIGQPPASTQEGATSKRWKEHIQDYLIGKRKNFPLPFKRTSSPVYERIFQAIAQVPYGQTATYGDIAKQAKTHARVVGNACGANPTLLLVPCHRIHAKNHLGGFMKGQDKDNLQIKQSLLSIEETYYDR